MNCQKCQKPFGDDWEHQSHGTALYNVEHYTHVHGHYPSGWKVHSDSHCIDCIVAEHREMAERRAAEERQRRQERLISEWERLCPPLYRVIDNSKVPSSFAAAFPRVMEYQMGERGLILSGSTGRGKTRAAWQLLKRLHFDGVKIRSFDCVEFGHECQHAFLEGKGESWAQRVADAQLLFIDDLGKTKLTDRVEAELFGVIERRMANLRPMIITTNDTGTTLESRMSPDRGGPMVRRLRECCDSIAFV